MDLRSLMAALPPECRDQVLPALMPLASAAATQAREEIRRRALFAGKVVARANGMDGYGRGLEAIITTVFPNTRVDLYGTADGIDPNRPETSGDPTMTGGCGCENCESDDCDGECDPCDDDDCAQCHPECTQGRSCCGYCSDCDVHHDTGDRESYCSECERCSECEHNCSSY